MRDERIQDRIWPWWVICFAIALILYAATASRGAQWQDSGYFILRAVTGEAVNPLGLALTHPLHYWLSRAALRLPWIEPAFAVTLVSSVAAALAVANLFGCVVALTGDRRAAGLAAASLLVANTIWQLATIAETYTITAALLTAECWCLIVFLKSALDPGETQAQARETGSHVVPGTNLPFWAFEGMWFFNGLSLANHNLALLTLPSLMMATILTVRRAFLPRFAVLGVFPWLAGAAPYGLLILQEASRSGDWAATLQSVLFGRAYGEEVLNISIGWDSLLISAGFVLLNFPNLLLPAALYGIGTALRSRERRWLYGPLILGLVLHGLFAIRYPVSDQHYFFVPTYVFLAMFAGVGLARWISGDTAASSPVKSVLATKNCMVLAIALIALTPVVYLLAPPVARRLSVLRFFERNKPYRDDYAYLFLPWSVSETSADKMSRQAVELAKETGVIIAEDRMAEFAIRYQLNRRGRQGVSVTREIDAKEFLRALGESRAIVLVPANADHPFTHPLIGSWRRTGDLYVFKSE